MSGAQRRFDLSASAALAPLLDHYQAKVTGAEICKGGPLNLTSTDDAVLLVEPDDRYEAFTVAGKLPSTSRRFFFVAVPGGGLACW
ncbi:DUF6188 family protein [Micromonospora zamorensis]|uniref:DUF6188 family protein n=1 Tax=Micromonospora zamorensis TaxID=709883 RepID=UPI003402D533